MTRGQRLVKMWLRQRKLEVIAGRRPNRVATTMLPRAADYAELARRIDSFARRVKDGSA